MSGDESNKNRSMRHRINNMKMMIKMRMTVEEIIGRRTNRITTNRIMMNKNMKTNKSMTNRNMTNRMRKM